MSHSLFNPRFLASTQATAAGSRSEARADAGSRRLPAVVLWSHGLSTMCATYFVAPVCLTGCQPLHAHCAPATLTLSHGFLFTRQYMHAGKSPPMLDPLRKLVCLWRVPMPG